MHIKYQNEFSLGYEQACTWGSQCSLAAGVVPLSEALLSGSSALLAPGRTDLYKAWQGQTHFKCTIKGKYLSLSYFIFLIPKKFTLNYFW